MKKTNRLHLFRLIVALVYGAQFIVIYEYPELLLVSLALMLLLVFVSNYLWRQLNKASIDEDRQRRR
jgi:putative flippase GtrA